LVSETWEKYDQLAVAHRGIAAAVSKHAAGRPAGGATNVVVAADAALFGRRIPVHKNRRLAAFLAQVL
jgi:hypothetical protein